MESQVRTSDAISAWASQVATVTKELKEHDTAVAGILRNGGPALDEARQLVERLQPTVPILMANLVSVGQVGLAYNNDIEQILVMLPQIVAIEQGALVANADTKQNYKGVYLSFNLNLNLPPTCNTGYLPAQQTRPQPLWTTGSTRRGSVLPGSAGFAVQCSRARNIPARPDPVSGRRR